MALPLIVRAAPFAIKGARAAVKAVKKKKPRKTGRASFKMAGQKKRVRVKRVPTQFFRNDIAGTRSRTRRRR